MTSEPIRFELPGRSAQAFECLVLDYTGTLSLDGKLLPGVAERLAALSRRIRIAVLTADTFGMAESQLRTLPVEVRIIRNGLEKAEFVAALGRERAIAIGNGNNDIPMLQCAGLGIAVIGAEGAAAKLLLAADIVTRDILEALDLIASPLRLKATLRE